MKIAIVNDIHFGKETEYRGRMQKLSRFSESELKKVLHSIEGRKDIDALVQLGDLIEDDEYQVDAQGYQNALKMFS